MFILYDGRAIQGDTEHAAVLSCADTLAEARLEARHFGFDRVAIYGYDVDDTTTPPQLTNERLVEVYTP